MSVVLAIVAALAAWSLHGLRTRLLVAAALVFAAMLSAGAAFGVALYPLTDAPVLGFALAAGLLAGRALPPKARAMFVLLAVLAALDSIQIVAAGPGGSSSGTSSGGDPAWYYYSMFLVTMPWGRVGIGIFDLLLIAAIAEHGRTRALPVVAAVVPGAIGLVVADLVFAVGRLDNLPLVPFVLLGWLTVELAVRLPGLRASLRAKSASQD